MDGLSLLLLVLAVAYWSHAIARTKGAFGVFAWARGSDEQPRLGGLLKCPVCLAVWLAVLFWLLLFTPFRALVEISAVAGGASLIGYYAGLWHN